MSSKYKYLASAVLATLTGVTIYFFQFSKEQNKVTKASASEILEILSEDPDEVIKKIGMEKVEVSLPVDGNGPRIVVRVEKGRSDLVPESIVIDHNSKQVEIDLETSETFETYKAD